MEIIIKDPPINTNPFRRFSHPQDSELLADQIVRWEITSQSHPKIIELCAGDAPLAAALTKKGWKPDNITCVDIFRTETPLVEGLHWEYIDLNNLGRELLKQNPRIPDKIEKMRTSYDLVAIQQAEDIYDPDLELAVCRYFVRPEGKFFIR